MSGTPSPSVSVAVMLLPTGEVSGPSLLTYQAALCLLAGGLVHDPAVLEDPGLLEAVTAAAQLAAANARLRAEVQPRVEELATLRRHRRSAAGPACCGGTPAAGSEDGTPTCTHAAPG